MPYFNARRGFIHDKYDEATGTLFLKPAPLPYPEPPFTKTKKRCEHTSCRKIGRYKVEGHRLCAQHYDDLWHLRNDVYPEGSYMVMLPDGMEMIVLPPLHIPGLEVESCHALFGTSSATT